MVLVGDEMAEENAIARHDVRTTTGEERRLFLLVMPTVCFRRSKVNRSQVSPPPKPFTQAFHSESSLDYPYYRRAKALSERKGGKIGLMLSAIVGG